MPRIHWTFRTLLLCAVLTGSAVAQEAAIPTSGPATHKPASPAADLNTDNSLRIGVGDLVETGVYGVPELSAKARVGSNGDIYLPLVDYVHVDGLTPEEAQQVIEKRLLDGGFVNNPHVTLMINEYSSQTVSVLGQVMRPGPYSVMGEKRLYDVISAAGGLSERAGKAVIITHRNAPGQPMTVRLHDGLNLSPEDNVPIRPGDTIVVQRAGIVYVVGDVARPSGFIMDNDRLTVLQALALAGGANKTAKLNAARILRQTQSGVTETPIALKKILYAKTSDVSLHADDILFIPGSAGKAAAYRAADVMIQAGGLSLLAVRP